MFLQRNLGGKLLVFQNTLPSLGVGRLKLRGDDSRVYGTDKEHSLRQPEDQFYKQMAAEFTKFQIGVNIYAFSDKYTDIGSLGIYSPLSIILVVFSWAKVLATDDCSWDTVLYILLDVCGKNNALTNWLTLCGRLLKGFKFCRILIGIEDRLFESPETFGLLSDTSCKKSAFKIILRFLELLKNLLCPFSKGSKQAEFWLELASCFSLLALYTSASSCIEACQFTL